MRVLCAPDSFKESLSAAEVAQAMRRGVLQVAPNAEVDCCPIADGGEGTVAAMLAATGGTTKHTTVTGPLGESVEAAWGIFGPSDEPTAIIEMAAASGLALVPTGRRNPENTTTFGTGELIRAALDAGARHIIMGIGGSATNDGGIGMAQALGVTLYDVKHQPLPHPATGSDMARVVHMDHATLDPRVRQTTITVACDVTNPLTGPQGAAAVYGPQKGATAKQITTLDVGLKHLANLWRALLQADVEAMPGAGAAGGLGGGLVAFLGATLRPGIVMVLDALDFDRRVAHADLCLTGEGRLDGQSLSGKACVGVAQRARGAGVPTVAIVGSAGPDARRTAEAGIESYHVIGEGLSAEISMRRAAELVERTTARVLSERLKP